jgi:hypothetical protein
LKKFIRDTKAAAAALDALSETGEESPSDCIELFTSESAEKIAQRISNTTDPLFQMLLVDRAKLSGIENELNVALEALKPTEA